MKKINLCIIALLFVNALVAQTTETRKLQDFTKINVSGKSYVIELLKGEENKIEIESADLTMDKIITTVSGDELKISVKGLFNSGNVKCKVYYKNAPSSIEVSNGAILKAEEAVVTDQMNLVTNSDGYININLTSKNVTVNCNTGGDMTIKGSTTNITANANGGAVLRMEQMEVENAVLKCILTAEMHIRAKTSLTTTTASGGKIHVLKPYPANIVESNENGGATLKE